MTTPSLSRGVAAPALAALAVATAPQARGQSWKEVASSRQVTGESELRVELEYGVGELTLRRGELGVLYRIALRYDEQAAEPLAEYEAGRLRIGVSGDAYGGGWTSRRRRMDSGEWALDNSLDLELAPDVPLDLNLSFAAGRGDIDLTGLAVRSLEMSTGASESSLRIYQANPERMRSASFNVGVADFRIQGVGNLNAEDVVVKAGLGSVALELDGEWPADSRLTLEMGLGALSIRVPEALGVRLRNRDTFLASVSIDGLTKRGDGWHSPNWESAPRKVEIDISAALGSIDLVRVP